MFRTALESTRENDVIIVWRLDRLSMLTIQVYMQQEQEVEKAGVQKN